MILIPTLDELYTAILSNLESQFDATIQPEGKAELRAQAAVQAATLKEQYLTIAQNQKNIWVDTCDEETLIRFGLVKINRQPFAAIAGQYDITVTGTTGTIIPAQVIAKSDDDSLNPGILYILDSDYTMPGATGTITVRSLTLGIESKLNIGDTLTFTAPLATINPGSTVTSEVIQPLAAETLDAYRTIVINAFRLEAQGGAATDYRIWAADVQGVFQVYPYAKSGAPCEINLFIEANPADSIPTGSGIPTQVTIDEVEAVVNFDPDTSLSQNERGRRPLQVVVHYLPITPLPVVITITGFQGLTPAKQTTLLAAFQDSVSAVRPFVSAADSTDTKNDIIDTNKLNNVIYTAIPGSVYGPVTFTVSGTPYSTYTFTGGDIPLLNATIIYN